MPYSLPSNSTAPAQNAIPDADYADAEGLVASVSDRPPLQAKVDELAPLIAANETAEQIAGPAAVRAHPGFSGARSVGDALRTAAQQYASARLAAARNPDMSAQGRAKADAAALAAFEASVQRMTDVLSSATDRLLAAFPAPTFPAPSAAITGETGLIYQSFPFKTASTFATEALTTLRRAVDPATPAAEQFRANQLLYHAYLPLTARRAEAPERHAQAYRGLNADLAALIDKHLETVLQEDRHELAVGAADAFRADFAYLVREVNESGAWDDITYTLAAASFFSAAS